MEIDLNKHICSKLEYASDKLTKISNRYNSIFRSFNATLKRITKYESENCKELNKNMATIVNFETDLSEKIEDLSAKLKLSVDELAAYFKENDKLRKIQIFNCHLEEINKHFEQIKTRSRKLLTKLDTILETLKNVNEIEKCATLKKQINILIKLINATDNQLSRLMIDVNLVAYPHLNKRPVGMKIGSRRRSVKRSSNKINGRRKSARRQPKLETVVEGSNENESLPNSSERTNRKSLTKTKSRARMPDANVFTFLNQPAANQISPDSVKRTVANIKKMVDIPNIFRIGQSSRTRSNRDGLPMGRQRH